MWNLHSVIKGRTEAKGISEKGAEEDIGTQQEVAEGYRKQCGGWGMRQAWKTKNADRFWSGNL